MSAYESSHCASAIAMRFRSRSTDPASDRAQILALERERAEELRQGLDRVRRATTLEADGPQ